MGQSKTRSEQLEGVVKIADKKKRDAIISAEENLGLCAVVLFFIMVGILAPPALGVLIWLV